MDPSFTASDHRPSSPNVFALEKDKFPPFQRREESEYVRSEYNSHGPLKTMLSEEDAKNIKAGIWTLLHEFDEYVLSPFSLFFSAGILMHFTIRFPPFTIQRISELAIHPHRHYKNAGKYLRAIERVLLVTSTIDAFPPVPPDESPKFLTFTATMDSLREASTPLFSPIPFLHEDARWRRSQSRSPPMSPLQLAAVLSPSVEELRLGASALANPVDEIAVEGDPIVDGPVIGLVDELDDPSPGHMSDHPTAISATTSKNSEPKKSKSGAKPETKKVLIASDKAAVTAKGKEKEKAAPKAMFGGSLKERFVKSSYTASDGAQSKGEKGKKEKKEKKNEKDTDEKDTVDEAMAVDEPEADK